MIGIGKMLVLFGAMMVVVGLVLIFFDKIPLLGKLPGDIHIKKENSEFYFPIMTSLMLSLLLSGILWLISFLGKK
jgi:hypothetical protein